MIDDVNIAALLTSNEDGTWPSVPPILTREGFISVHRQFLELAGAATDSDRATDLLDAASVLVNYMVNEYWDDAELVLLLAEAFTHLIEDLRSDKPDFYGPLPLAKARAWFRHLRLVADSRPHPGDQNAEIR